MDFLGFASKDLNDSVENKASRNPVRDGIGESHEDRSKEGRNSHFKVGPVDVL